MASLTVERLAPVVVLVTLISAAGTAWWSGSVKRPLRVPKLLCPRAVEHKSTQRESPSARRDVIRMEYKRSFSGVLNRRFESSAGKWALTGPRFEFAVRRLRIFEFSCELSPIQRP